MNILSSLVNLDLGPAGVLAALDYGVVFFGLILLMTVVVLIGKCFTPKNAKAKAKAAPVAPVAAPGVEQADPGPAGNLKIHDVPPKTAAMLMAIVADKMGKLLNELRFISIKEVK